LSPSTPSACIVRVGVEVVKEKLNY
jgi:hypothetical protein